jgi:hypothetical protein
MQNPDLEKNKIMQDLNLEYRRFQIAKYIVSSKIYNEYINIDRLYNDLHKELRNKTGLSDAFVLLNMVKKEVDSHNSKNSSERTRFDNLRYKDVKIYQSKIFKKYLKISTSKIDKAIKENIDLDDYDIYKKCFQL